MGISLDKIFNVLSLGVVRANFFSAIVCNPKNKVSIETFNIKERFNVFPKIEGTKEDLLKEFRKFVVNNSVREVQEFLDRGLNITRKTLLDIYKTKKINIKIPKEINDPIEKLNILLNNKLEEEGVLFTNLKAIRNCMSHKMHKVDEEIKIKYSKMMLFVSNPETGEEAVASIGETIDVAKFPVGSPVGVKVVAMEKIFSVGSIISFDNADDLIAIYWTIYCAIDKLKEIIILEILNNGIPINMRIGEGERVIKNNEDYNKLKEEIKSKAEQSLAK